MLHKQINTFPIFAHAVRTYTLVQSCITKGTRFYCKCGMAVAPLIFLRRIKIKSTEIFFSQKKTYIHSPDKTLIIAKMCKIINLFSNLIYLAITYFKDFASIECRECIVVTSHCFYPPRKIKEH